MAVHVLLSCVQRDHVGACYVFIVQCGATRVQYCDQYREHTQAMESSYVVLDAVCTWAGWVYAGAVCCAYAVGLHGKVGKINIGSVSSFVEAVSPWHDGSHSITCEHGFMAFAVLCVYVWRTTHRLHATTYTDRVQTSHVRRAGRWDTPSEQQQQQLECLLECLQCAPAAEHLDAVLCTVVATCDL
jgi:hypothetical protein